MLEEDSDGRQGRLELVLFLQGGRQTSFTLFCGSAAAAVEEMSDRKLSRVDFFFALQIPTF